MKKMISIFTFLTLAISFLFLSFSTFALDYKAKSIWGETGDERVTVFEISAKTICRDGMMAFQIGNLKTEYLCVKNLDELKSELLERFNSNEETLEKVVTVLSLSQKKLKIDKALFNDGTNSAGISFNSDGVGIYYEIEL